MPVTLRIVDHPATSWQASAKVTSSDELLKEACPTQHQRCKRIVQCSFTRSSLREQHTSASRNGLIWSAYHAYSSHHHLVLRPEDVWFAILTQLSFYINAHAEELRAFFVAHDGQKHLEVISNAADFGFMAQMMTQLIAKNVVDPGLRDWVMPAFSTTTDCDKVVGAVLFMGAMEKYFSYQMTVMCGIPSVTLLGEVEDWRQLLARLDSLEQLGEEPSLFAKMLRPVLSHMVLSFDDPTSAQVVNFWNTIVHHNVLFSGTDYLSGWLTAFCFWDEDGRAERLVEHNTLFGDVPYPCIDVDKVPAGFASVPVLVDDNGDKYEATMVAGSVGIQAREAVSLSAPSSSTMSAGTIGAASPMADLGASSLSEETAVISELQDGDGTETESLDTVQPLSGWWIFENVKDGDRESRASEALRLSNELSGALHAGGEMDRNFYLNNRQTEQASMA